MQHRLDMVHLYHDKGLSQRQIASQFDVVPSTVHYWLSYDGQTDRHPRGRPRKTDPDTDEDLRLAILQNPFLSAVELRRQLVPHLSVDTVRRRLRALGLRCRTPARKPFLTHPHRQNRFLFATHHLTWDVPRWHRVVFSDEKIFRTSSRGPLHVYRPDGSDRFDPQYLVSSTNEEGPRFTIAVWMAFGGRGVVRQLHLIEQDLLDSRYYTTYILPLVEEALVRDDLVFMQDRSSIHTSRMTRDWLQQRNVHVLWDWPARGPDMNPVENVWAELVRRTRPSALNRDQLWENVLRAFEELPDAYFDKLVESMPNRMMQVVEKRGGWTKY